MEISAGPAKSGCVRSTHKSSRRQLVGIALAGEKPAIAVIIVASIVEGLLSVFAISTASKILDRRGTAMLVILVAASVAISIAAQIIATRHSVILTVRAAHRVRMQLAQRVLTLSIGRLSKHGTGEFIDRVNDDVESLYDYLGRPARHVIRGTATLLAALPTLAFVSMPIFVIAIVTIICMWLSLRPIMRRQTKASIETSESYTEITVRLEEGVSARDDLRALAAQEFALRRHADAGSAVITNGKRRALFSSFTWGASNGFIWLNGALNAGVAIWMVRNGTLGLGAAIAATGIALYVFDAVHTVTNEMRMMVNGVSTLARITELYDETGEQEFVDSNSSETKWGAAPRIEIRNLTFSYQLSNETTSNIAGDIADLKRAGAEDVADPRITGERVMADFTPKEAAYIPDASTVEAGLANKDYSTSTNALHEINLNIESNESVGIVGRTGAGKSTLVKLLARLVEPPEGTILIDGRDITKIGLSELRRNVGFVSQRTDVFEDTLFANVTLYDPTISRSSVESAFADLSLTEWVDGLPHGLDTILGKRGVELSAGEEQLVAFARLLARDPAVIILDEATSKLDPDTERRVRLATRKLFEGRTAIVVAHRTATLSEVTVIREFVDGRLSPTLKQLDVVHLDEELAMGLTHRIVHNEYTEDELNIQETETETARSNHVEVSVNKQLGATIDSRRVRSKQSQGEISAKDVWRSVLGIVRHAKWQFGLSGILWIALGLTIAAQTSLFAKAVSYAESSPSAATRYFEYALPIAVTTFVVGFVGVYWIIQAWDKASVLIREQVLRGQTESSENEIGREPNNPGSLVALGVNNNILMNVADNIFDVMGQLVTFIPVLFVSSTLLAIPVLISLPALGIAAGLSLRSQCRRRYLDRLRAQSRVGQLISNCIGSAVTFKLFACERTAVEAIGLADSTRSKALEKERLTRMWADVCTWVPYRTFAVMVVGLAYGGFISHSSAIVIYQVLTVSSFAGYVSMDTVINFANAKGWMRVVRPYLSRNVVLAQADEKSYSPWITNPENRSHFLVESKLKKLELIGVSNYYADHRVLNEINLSLDQGEMVVVCGRVGSGKTALMRLCAGLVVPTEGEMLWNGQAIGDRAELLRPPNVGYVSQIPNLMSGTIAENIGLDRIPLDDIQIVDAIKAASMEPDLQRLQGIQTEIGYRGVKLSGGQVQRVALARALAQSNQLLVLDDISSALDHKTELEIWQTIRNSGRTVVASTYKRFVADMADKVVLIDSGSIIARGKMSELGDEFAGWFS